ncbi:MAG TPA: hypothetical protein VGI19_13180 [Candidatus Cybelea sp.]
MMGSFSRRSYVVALGAWFALYAVLLIGSLTLIDRNVVTWLPLRVAVGLSPMIAGFGILAVIMREYRAGDELQQRMTAEAIMFAFGATAIITFSYGFLQRSVGAPDISYFWVWAILGATWAIGSFIARQRYK